MIKRPLAIAALAPPPARQRIRARPKAAGPIGACAFSATERQSDDGRGSTSAAHALKRQMEAQLPRLPATSSTLPTSPLTLLNVARIHSTKMRTLLPPRLPPARVAAAGKLVAVVRCRFVFTLITGFAVTIVGGRAEGLFGLLELARVLAPSITAEAHREQRCVANMMECGDALVRGPLGCEYLGANLVTRPQSPLQPAQLVVRHAAARCAAAAEDQLNRLLRSLVAHAGKEDDTAAVTSVEDAAGECSRRRQIFARQPFGDDFIRGSHGERPARRRVVGPSTTARGGAT